MYDTEPTNRDTGARVIWLEEVERRYHLGFRDVTLPVLGPYAQDGGPPIRQLFERYVGLINSVAVRDITVAEVEWLLATTRRYIRYDGVDARKDLLHIIDVGIAAMNSDYMTGQCFKAESGEPFDEGDHPGLHVFEAFRTEASHWSPLQCMKVIEALEYYRARNRFRTEITPKMVHAFLNGSQSTPTTV